MQTLPIEVQEAVRTSKLTVSQGYIFASNIGHPGFDVILGEALEGAMSNAVLLKRFKDYDKATLGRPAEPVAVCFRRMGDIRKIVTEAGAGMSAEELFNLLQEIKSVGLLVSNLKAEIEAAAAAKASGQSPEVTVIPKKRIG